MPPHIEVELNRGCVALIDESDADSVGRYNWNVIGSRNVYAATVLGNARIMSMHRFILCPPDELLVDHINGNGLDNRQCNLRFATAQQNAWNAKKRVGCWSRFKGVSLATDKIRSCPWRVRVRDKYGTEFHIGYFATEMEAAVAYDAAAIEIVGEFCRLNFPENLKGDCENVVP